MAFHEVRFPAALSFGSVGGPERRTEIVTLANGFEERNSLWAHSRRRYDAGLGMRSMEDVAQVLAFFEARRGSLHGFRWKDWADYRSGAAAGPATALDQQIGVGDGAETVFTLRKTYASGGVSYTRPIAKPVAGSVRIAVDGVELPQGSDWDCMEDTGEVILAVAPAGGAVITAGFEFDVPVRFDTDTIQISMGSFEAGEVPSVPVVEVRI